MKKTIFLFLLLSSLLNNGKGYDASTEGTVGIDIQNTYPNFDHLTVSYNRVENTQNAFHLLNVGGCIMCDQNAIKITTLSYNNVSQVIPLADLGATGIIHYGVWAENCYQVEIKNSTINWNSTPTIDELNLMRGISVNNSIKCTLTENKTTNMGAGINFFGNCKLTNLYCNTMETCWNGAYLQDASTVVSDQGTAAESWNSKWVSNIATNKVDGNAISSFQWFYYLPDGSFYDPQPCNTFFVNATQATWHNGCTAPSSPMDEDDRERTFGSTVRDSTIDDPDSAYFKYADDEAYYKVTKTDTTLLDMNVASDPLYQNKFDELQQGNIGKFEDIKNDISNGNLSFAYTKLTNLQDQNIIESNKKFVLNYYLLYITDTLTPDSVSIEQLIAIAHMHPFYGGEAVYMARAILNLKIEDLLPPLRAGHTHNSNSNGTYISLHGKLFPVPAIESVTFVYEHPDNINVLITVTNSLGQSLNDYLLKQNSISIPISNLASGFYRVKVCENGIEKEEHKLIIIR